MTRKQAWLLFQADVVKAVRRARGRGLSLDLRFEEITGHLHEGYVDYDPGHSRLVLELNMPLTKSPSKKAFKANVKKEIAAGRPPRQAVAIAESVKDRAKRRK